MWRAREIGGGDDSDAWKSRESRARIEAGWCPVHSRERFVDKANRKHKIVPVLRSESVNGVGDDVDDSDAFEDAPEMPAEVAIEKWLTNTEVDRAATQQSQAVNGKTENIPVRLADLIKDGDVSRNVDMAPGDVLIVPQTYF